MRGASLAGIFLDWTSEDLRDGFRCLVAFPYLSDSFTFSYGGHTDYGIYYSVAECAGECQDSYYKLTNPFANAQYQVSFASTDGVAVNVTIDGTQYDQSQGCTFLLTLVHSGGDDDSVTGSTVQVRQVRMDLSGVDSDDVSGSIPSLDESSNEFLALAEEIAAAQAGDGNDDGNA